MRIAIDTIPLLSPLTGVGQYTSQLIKHFNLLSPENDYTYYYGYFTKKLLHGTKQTFTLKNVLWKIPFLKYGVRRAKDIFSHFHFSDFDLYFEPNFVPLNIRAKGIVTTVHDFSFRLYPQTHPQDRVEYFSRHFFANVKRSNHIITDSAYIKGEAVEILGLPDDMITPIHLGVDHEVFRLYDQESLDLSRRELKLPESFILFVGTREPRKNLDGLLHAYLALPQHVRNESKLVLVGPRGWEHDVDERMAQKIGKSVVNLGYVDRQRLAYVFNLATLLVFPSLYEGFGLPPLEAMACGCPVIVSKAASLPEVCGDAAYYVDPKNVDSIAGGIDKMLDDKALRESLIAKGIERVKLFNWEKTTRQTLDIFEHVLKTAEGG
jgi:glycosyltransferase involved in cell wall biosynthesis